MTAAGRLSVEVTTCPALTGPPGLLEHLSSPRYQQPMPKPWSGPEGTLRAPYGSFRKLGVLYLIWRPYNKDPAI